MNAATCEWSGAARETFETVEGRPLFHAGWRRTVFIHYEVDPAALQPQVPFPLETRDGKAYVKPVKGEKFSINGYTMGKVELYGYLGQLRDDEHITGVVLKGGGTDTQRQVIVSSCKTLQIEAFEEDGGDLKALPLGT